MTAAGDAAAPGDRLLDVRGLPAPEPLELCLQALDELGLTQRLQLLIDREPHPLYAMLERAGFQHDCVLEPPHYRVTIWRG
jgi:uncharacterized protein (DUF2249 family)